MRVTVSFDLMVLTHEKVSKPDLEELAFFDTDGRSLSSVTPQNNQKKKRKKKKGARNTPSIHYYYYHHQHHHQYASRLAYNSSTQKPLNTQLNQLTRK
jgi:hypothetical protein